MIKKFLILFYSFLLMNIMVFSVNFEEVENIKFDSYTVDDGLSNNVVYSIVQDHQGFMWFGTEDKLNMYDGYKFTTFEHDDDNLSSISSNSASNIYLDRQGNVWIGTWGGGLNMYDSDNKKFVHYLHNPNSRESLSDNRVQSLYQDANSNLWIGTYKGGLNKLNLRTNKIQRYIHEEGNQNTLSNNRVWAITEDDEGNIIVGTSNGLNVLDIKTDKFTRFLPSSNDEKGPSFKQIRTLHKGSNGKIWIGTNNGMNLFLPKERKFKHFIPKLPDNPSQRISVNSILEDEDNIVWVGTSRGLFKFNSEKEQYIDFFSNKGSKFSNTNFSDIRSVYKDRSGLIWLGTRGGGINKFNPKSTFSYLVDYEKDSNTNSIIEDRDGNLWISNSSSLYMYNPKSKQTTLALSKIILSSFLDQTGALWFGSNNGTLYKYNSMINDFESYQISSSQDTVKNILLTIKEVKNGSLFIGTYGNGAFIFDMESKNITKHIKSDNSHSGLSGNEVYSIFKDSLNNIWFGTNNGLNLYDEKNETFHQFSKGYVYCIYEDNNHSLWFGSRKGLYHLKADLSKKASEMNKSSILYNTKHNLSNNLVYSILNDDDENLWLSTDFGLSKFNPKLVSFRNFHLNDGLQENKFNKNVYFKSKSGVLYFGGINGITYFNPSSIKASSTAPKIVIRNFKKFEESFEFEKSIDRIKLLKLSYKDVLFSFEFTLTDYTDISKNRFFYKLEGFEEDWINNHNRNYVRYTNIKPGKYIFKVKGENSDGLKTKVPDQVEIIITPPWWEHNLFRLIAVVSLITLLLTSHLYRIKFLKRNNKKLEKLIMERTAELEKSNKKLEHLVKIDALTQIPNRGYFDKALQEEWKRMKNEKKSISLIFLDIDCFKKYNDHYGHQAGDQCLREFAQILRDVEKQPADLVCRYGGEEFCIILPNSSVKRAKDFAEKLQIDLKEANLIHETSSVKKYITCSIGIASVIPNENIKISDLIRWADSAVYKAKNNGRDTVVINTKSFINL